MTTNEFQSEVNKIIRLMNEQFNGTKMEAVNTWCGQPLRNVFQYAATSEACMENNLAQVGKERHTTFMSDISIGEWCDGIHGVLDTIKRAMNEWHDNEEYMAEFILCVNWKAWEHHGRKNPEWTKFYSCLYDNVRDLMYDYYADDEEKTSYLYEYLD